MWCIFGPVIWIMQCNRPNVMPASLLACWWQAVMATRTSRRVSTNRAYRQLFFALTLGKKCFCREQMEIKKEGHLVFLYVSVSQTFQRVAPLSNSWCLQSYTLFVCWDFWKDSSSPGTNCSQFVNHCCMHCIARSWSWVCCLSRYNLWGLPMLLWVLAPEIWIPQFHKNLIYFAIQCVCKQLFTVQPISVYTTTNLSVSI